jgi:hypothetical protein
MGDLLTPFFGRKKQDPPTPQHTAHINLDRSEQLDIYARKFAQISRRMARVRWSQKKGAWLIQEWDEDVGTSGGWVTEKVVPAGRVESALAECRKRGILVGVVRDRGEATLIVWDGTERIMR